MANTTGGRRRQRAPRCAKCGVRPAEPNPSGGYLRWCAVCLSTTEKSVLPELHEEAKELVEKALGDRVVDLEKGQAAIMAALELLQRTVEAQRSIAERGGVLQAGEQDVRLAEAKVVQEATTQAFNKRTNFKAALKKMKKLLFINTSPWLMTIDIMGEIRYAEPLRPSWLEETFWNEAIDRLAIMATADQRVAEMSIGEDLELGPQHQIGFGRPRGKREWPLDETLHKDRHMTMRDRVIADQKRRVREFKIAIQKPQ